MANHKLRSRRSIYISQRACKEVTQTKAHFVHAADLVRCMVAVAFASVCRPPRPTGHMRASGRPGSMHPAAIPTSQIPNPPRHHHAASQNLLATAVSKIIPLGSKFFYAMSFSCLSPCDSYVRFSNVSISITASASI